MIKPCRYQVRLSPSARLRSSLGWEVLFPDRVSHGFDGGLRRDGQLAIAPTTTPGLTRVTMTKATLIHQAMCQSAAVTPITVSNTLSDKIE